MGWRFICSQPRISFGGSGRTTIYLGADQEFSFASTVQPSAEQVDEWSRERTSVEVSEVGAIQDLARVARWKLEPDSAGYIVYGLRAGRISCGVELDAERFQSFRRMCEVALLSPRTLVLSLHCQVIGFASNGGTGAPTLSEFSSGFPISVRLNEIQFGLWESEP
jgi:hypothetical protein